MNYLTTQLKANKETRNNFKNYTSHRNRSTDLILSQEKSGNILIIGAGNCNDIDLKTLSSIFEEVHLLDIDQQALEYGVNNQIGFTEKIHFHIADISQVSNSIDKLIAEPFGSRAKRIIKSLQSLPFNSTLSNSFEMVVSQCLVSQLVYPVYKTIVEEDNPSNVKIFKRLIEELVVSHLKQMAAYLVKGGIGITITDTVSSEDIPDTIQDNQHTLLQILKDVYFNPAYMGYGHNIFGTNIYRLFAEHKMELAPLIDLKAKNALNTPCWKWDFSPERQYIVQAFVFSRI